MRQAPERRRRTLRAMRPPARPLRVLLLGLALWTPASAGGGGAPRPLTPDFTTASGPVDCDPTANRANGCRLLVPVPAGTPLPGPGQVSITQNRDRLTVLYRPATGARTVTLCCGLQLPLSPIPGTGVWAVTAQVSGLDRAVLSTNILVDGRLQTPGQRTLWRGPKAPAALERAAYLVGKLHRFTLRADSPLIGVREITVYTPPGWNRAKPLPVVYLADGAAVSGFANTLEPAIRKGTVPPVILVGIDSAPSIPPGGTEYRPEDDKRSQEYLEGWQGGTERFAAHEVFLLQIVLPHLEREYGASSAPNDRVVGGLSNGGAWAISMVARHPDVFRGVLALSPSNSGRQQAPHKEARVFTGGGTLEPAFQESARNYAALTNRSGQATRVQEWVGGHDYAVWEEMLPKGLAFLLGK